MTWRFITKKHTVIWEGKSRRKYAFGLPKKMLVAALKKAAGINNMDLPSIATGSIFVAFWVMAVTWHDYHGCSTYSTHRRTTATCDRIFVVRGWKTGKKIRNNISWASGKSANGWKDFKTADEWPRNVTCDEVKKRIDQRIRDNIELGHSWK